MDIYQKCDNCKKYRIARTLKAVKVMEGEELKPNKKMWCQTCVNEANEDDNREMSKEDIVNGIKKGDIKIIK